MAVCHIGISMGANWTTKRHKPGTFFKAQRFAGAIVSPLFACPYPHWTWYALASRTVWTWGHPGGVWETSSASTWTRGDSRVVPSRQYVKVCGESCKDWYTEHIPQVRYRLFGFTKFKQNKVMVQPIIARPKQQRQGT